MMVEVVEVGEVFRLISTVNVRSHPRHGVHLPGGAENEQPESGRLSQARWEVRNRSGARLHRLNCAFEHSA